MPSTFLGQPSHAPLAHVLEDLEASGLELAEHAHRQARAERHGPMPEALMQMAAQCACTLAPRGLWSHQADAIAAAAKGDSVVLSTSTSSGKSLVFQVAAADALERRPGSKVLALYPTKALIDDQLGRWASAMVPAGWRVARIHGAVKVADRLELLKRNDVILATPDIVHAWLLREPKTQPFLDAIHLLILDEAHAYDGAFGSHMVYMLRRLRAASAIAQIIATTATLADPVDFVEKLTGLPTVHVGPQAEGAPSQGRHFLRVFGDGLGGKVDLLCRLSSSKRTRFLAFADSRKAVEQIVEQAQRELDQAGLKGSELILPYRSGFEEEDRARIQKSLSRGRLRGVVATSALELGIDIGDIDAVILLTIPGTQRSVWQRAGRAGRGGMAGVCVVFDDGRAFERGGLDAWLDLPIEPSRLYLHNRLIQYGQALCAAYELQNRGASVRRAVLDSLPDRFGQMLANELEPMVALPDDCLQVKSRLDASGAPHWGLPMRSTGEDSWQICIDQQPDQKLGTVTTQQMLRESYPGAVYRYIAQPYRITSVMSRTHEINARPVARGRSTEPLRITKVFPRLPAGLLASRRGPSLEVFEAQLQVSERVLGFRERAGSATHDHLYQPGAAYAQAPLSRTFNTTGVVWSCNTQQGSEALALRLKQAFCHLLEVAEGDVGTGETFARPQGNMPAHKGFCLYDATAGSLRLTSPLQERFAEVVALALSSTDAEETALRQDLELLLDAAQGLGATTENQEAEAAERDAFVDEEAQCEHTLRVLEPGQEALLVDGTFCKDVTIVGYGFGPLGLLYDLRNGRPGTWKVPAARVRPRADQARWIAVDMQTGEPVTAAA